MPPRAYETGGGATARRWASRRGAGRAVSGIGGNFVTYRAGQTGRDARHHNVSITECEHRSDNQLIAAGPDSTRFRARVTALALHSVE
jgi:hypothetical protein